MRSIKSRRTAGSGGTRHQINAERDRDDAEQIAELDVLAEHQPARTTCRAAASGSDRRSQRSRRRPSTDETTANKRGSIRRAPGTRRRRAAARSARYRRHLENVNANGSSTIPAARFCTPLPTQQAALRRQHLEQDGADHDRGQRGQREQDAVQAVVPTDMRCQTMKPTPVMPSTSPMTLRQVSASPRNSAASTAVNTGLALTIRPPRPAETVLSPV